MPPGHVVVTGYRVIEHLRRSHEFDTYAAWDEARDAPCVVKVLRDDRREDQRAAHALIAEGLLLRRLRHPHLVTAYEVYRSPAPAVILETLGGETLSSLLDERGRLSLAETAYLGLQLCSVLSYLHKHRVIHRDVKPSNIVSQAGSAKLLDLSIACRLGHRGGSAGTRGYMAPEQRRGRVGPWTDVFGLGCVLYESLTGSAALGDEGTDVNAPAVLSRRRIPRFVAAAIDASLAPDPESRPPLEAVASALDAVVGYRKGLALPKRMERGARLC